MTRTIGLAIFALPVLLVGCSDSSSTAPSKQSSFRQVGYFKNASNRIFTIAYTEGTSESEIRAHAEGLMYTPGKMTAAYFYQEGSMIPADGVTLAQTVFEANEVLYDTPGLSSWRYAYMRSFKGTTEFVDCEQHPNHALSRKK